MRFDTEQGQRGKTQKNCLSILRDMYGCARSYVSLQQCFFSRKQQEGESLQEFSHALCCLMEKVERCPEEDNRCLHSLTRPVCGVCVRPQSA